MPLPTYFPLKCQTTNHQWWYASPFDWAAANGHYELVKALLHLDSTLLLKLTSLRRLCRLETLWDEKYGDVARCRALIGRKLLDWRGENSLIRAGYGGWLLYTAASAGDIGFVNKLLEKDPFLVFGEGEYGVTDIFYASSRSKNTEIFRVLLDFSLSTRFREVKMEGDCSFFVQEMMNRAVHAAAMGGNVEILREFLGDCSDALDYRDAEGCTLLHTACGKGQVEVVKYLLSSYNIINSKDDHGNTALHVAAFWAHSNLLDFLISESPSYLPSITNNHGDTFLHAAVSGVQAAGFRRMDRQMEFIKRLVCLIREKLPKNQDLINLRNCDGRTVLHLAVTGNIQTDLVEILMSLPFVSLNVCDLNGMTPLDLLIQRPRSACSEMLIKRFILAGGTSNAEMTDIPLNYSTEIKGIGGTPGTSFRITDAEIFHYIAVKKGSDFDSDRESTFSGDQGFLKSQPLYRRNGDSPIPLRQRFGNIKRVFSSSSFNYGEKKVKMEHKRHSSFNRRVMNKYFCFSAKSLAVEDSIRASKE